MWKTSRPFRGIRIARSKRVGVAVALLACVGLTGCIAAETHSPASSGEARTVTPMPNDADSLAAGTYLVSGFTVPFEITVPDGWGMNNGFLLTKEFTEGKGVFVMFSSPNYVPTDACGSSGRIPEVEPSVEAFADALAAAESTVATAPIAVEVSGFHGVEFDLSVQSGLDIAGCPQEHVCIHSEMQSNCTRYYQTADQRETYRVFDLSGDRAVVAVGQWENGVDPALVTEARAVFDSIVFASGE